MGIDVTHEDLAERHAVAVVARNWISIARDEHASGLAVYRRLVRHGLRRSVGEPEVLPRDAVLGIEVQPKPAHDFHLIGKKDLFDGVGPIFGFILVMPVEQQQGMNGQGGMRLQLLIFLRTADLADGPVPGRMRRRRRGRLPEFRHVAAPERSARDDGRLPLRPDAVA